MVVFLLCFEVLAEWSLCLDCTVRYLRVLPRPKLKTGLVVRDLITRGLYSNPLLCCWLRLAQDMLFLYYCLTWNAANCIFLFHEDMDWTPTQKKNSWGLNVLIKKKWSSKHFWKDFLSVSFSSGLRGRRRVLTLVKYFPEEGFSVRKCWFEITKCTLISVDILPCVSGIEGEM